jgi:hypothetical protein
MMPFRSSRLLDLPVAANRNEPDTLFDPRFTFATHPLILLLLREQPPSCHNPDQRRGPDRDQRLDLCLIAVLRAQRFLDCLLRDAANSSKRAL